MTPDARARRLAALGLDQLYELAFDDALAAQTPEGFVRETLAGRLGIAHAVIGADFRFGARRAGDPAAMAALGAAQGFGVTTAPLVSLGGAGDVSSTAIREALSRGDPRAAAAMLGHLHRIEGPVIHGEKRGRTLGYPTANMALDGLHLPRFGVYAVRVDVLDGPHAGTRPGAASLGVRPHYGGGAPNLETHLLDFRGDLYGARLSVGLQDYLRPEASFGSEAAFLARMAQDCAEARRLLA
jgi:riboflavin kinase/FMN adenylyltransferase